jgi:hypothetical protein
MSLKIGFVGKAGSGKTTISDELVKRYDFHKLSFATPLKKFAEDILMRPIDKTNPLDRKFLQQLGTDVCRAREKNIWLMHFFKSYYLLDPKETGNIKVVVDDCRFKNEADYLKHKGFYIIRIVGRSTEIGENKNHLSEIEQDFIDADFELDNSGTIEETMYKLIHDEHIPRKLEL